MPVKLPDVLVKQWAMAATHPDVNVNQQKCSIQMEEAAVHMEDIGGEMNSSDSEPEDFCHCRTVNSECGDTLCYTA